MPIPIRRWANAVLLCGAVAGLGSAACAREYHVSPSGSDAAAGTAAAPLKTIQKAASAMLAGDACVIHAGVYRETVRPENSGEAAKPLVFAAAPGEDATIAGTEVVTGWSAHKDRIEKTSVAGPIEQVFVNGRIMTPARFPDSPANHWQPGTMKFLTKLEPVEALTGRDYYKLECDQITQPDGYWTGAVVWGLSARLGWVASTAAVAGSEKGALRIGRDPKAAVRPGRTMAPWYGSDSGRGFLTNSLHALDAEREWHWQDGTLYLYPPGGARAAELTVEVTRRKYAFDLSERKFIELRGLRLFAASVNLDRAEDCVLDGLRARWPCVQRVLRGGFNRGRDLTAASEGAGLALGGRRNTLRNSVVAFSTGDGVSVYGEGNTVDNCVIHDCNLYGCDCAPVCVTGRGHVLRHSTLFNGGRSIVVHRFLFQGRIEHNHLYNAGLLTNDLGMTYSYQTKSEGTLLAYNIVHHNWGRAPGNVGIYLDDMSQDHIVHHNLVYQVSEALALNPPSSKNNLVAHNTLDGYNVSIGMGTHRPQDLTGTRLVNNIFTHPLPRELPNIRMDKNLFRETDPKFVDAGRQNYQLAADSPAVDAGVEVSPYSDGFTGKAPDLGAFEYGKEPWKAGTSIPREQWDEDPDWAVLPGHKGPCYEKPPAPPQQPTQPAPGP